MPLACSPFLTIASPRALTRSLAWRRENRHRRSSARPPSPSAGPATCGQSERQEAGVAPSPPPRNSSSHNVSSIRDYRWNILPNIRLGPPHRLNHVERYPKARASATPIKSEPPSQATPCVSGRIAQATMQPHGFLALPPLLLDEDLGALHFNACGKSYLDDP